jgi:hypothetical protein
VIPCAVPVTHEHAVCLEEAKDASERIGIDAQRHGQLLLGARVLGDGVRDAQVGHDLDGTRRRMGAGELEYDVASGLLLSW